MLCLYSGLVLLISQVSCPQHVTIIHKSNVLSVTDGLFRETVRSVPRLSEGKFDDVEIAEQLVDSAVYRYVHPQCLVYHQLKLIII